MARISIIGAGGIGCSVGYALAAAGHDVLLVDADEEKVRSGNEQGVGVDGRPPQRARFVSFANWEADPRRITLLCTKCYDNPAVLARVPGTVPIIPIQNGFDPLLEAQGHQVEGIASYVSECHARRTHTRITRRGILHVGTRGSGGAAAVAEFVGLFRGATPFRVKQVSDVRPYKYTKLMYNAAIGPLAAAAGLDNGRLLSVPRARRLFFALLQENYGILQKAGVPLARIGPCHPRTAQRILRRVAIATFLGWVLYPTLRGTYCSMSGDLPRGRSEIEYYNGHLVRLAGSFPCPLNRRLYGLVKRMEAERLPPALERLDELE